MFTAITLSGPIIAGIGVLADLPFLFWIGVVLAAGNLFMNVASGAMRSPILPAVFMIGGAVFLSPWYWGAGVGLLVWTLLEGAGELMPFRRPD